RGRPEVGPLRHSRREGRAGSRDPQRARCADPGLALAQGCEGGPPLRDPRPGQARPCRVQEDPRGRVAPGADERRESGRPRGGGARRGKRLRRDGWRYRALSIAVHLSFPSVRLLLSGRPGPLTAREWVELMAWWSMEPRGELRADWRMGLLA